MRAAFIGAEEVTKMTARQLVDRGHEVVIIESDKSVIDSLADELDCSFLHGDGSNPRILREAGPEQTDLLFCVTNNDQINIIAGLVGRSLGFKRVVVSITDPEFREICEELGLEDTIVPSRTISGYLADLASGVDILELSTVIRGEVRFFEFTVGDDEPSTVGELNLPDKAKAICIYRKDDFLLPDDDTTLRKGDNVVILTHSRNLSDLRERWQPQAAESEGKGGRP